jgi:hypothetical protein
MDSSERSTSEIVKAGFDRVCDDFTTLVAPIGFKRTKAKSRAWHRQAGGLIDQIYFHRSGSSYGAPLNNSIDIRVHFSTHSVDAKPPFPLNGASSDRLRDDRGYAYHLRFNALTWSTYERCLADLVRITNDHGLPWFSSQTV